MWTRQNIQKIILDFSLKASNNPFNGVASLNKTDNADWKDDMGLDSIELMQLATYINLFFNLFEMKDPPYLLSSNKLDDWVELVFDAKQKSNEYLNFTTSGTSGQSKTIKHSINYLEREVSFLASLFSESTHIIPYVPSYTIYGFLFTICLPEKLGIPLRYPSETNWQEVSANSLIVATPFHWQLLLPVLPEKILHCLGVSAASPLYDGLYQSITSKNITLTEIYGSTETSGVAYRKSWKDSFSLFPYWEFINGNYSIAIKDRDSHTIYSLMDDITQTGYNQFSIVGRKDKEIKIAGILVNLDYVNTMIRQLPNIQQCSVSAKAIDNDVILQASISLYRDGENERADIKQQIRETFPSHERPRIIHFTTFT